MRRRKWLVLGLGAAAVAVGGWFASSLVSRGTDIDQYVRAIASSNEPDAVWAFEKLKEIEGKALEDLLYYLDDDRKARLRRLSRSDGRFHGGTNGMRSFEVRDVALFILSTGLLSNNPLGTLPDARQIEALKAVERELRAMRPQENLVQRAWREVSRWSLVKPPSRSWRLAPLAHGGDIAGLVEVLTGSDRAEAAWSLAVLEGLPAERIAALAAETESAERTAITALIWDTGSGSWSASSSSGLPLGRVVRYLLHDRRPRKAPEAPWPAVSQPIDPAVAIKEWSE